MRVSADGIVPASAASELALETTHAPAGATVDVGSADRDEIVLVASGHGLVSSGGGQAVHEGSAALLVAGETARLTAGSDGLQVVRASVGPGADLHAPLGPRETLVATERVEAGSATGKRSFQILFGPHNGSARATLFVGYVPPGAAPWHFHLYDEIVWIWRGEGRFHVAGAAEALGPGSAFRITPREAHIVENTSTAEELVVVGLFTPAGSPSAAYLAPAGNGAAA